VVAGKEGLRCQQGMGGPVGVGCWEGVVLVDVKLHTTGYVCTKRRQRMGSKVACASFPKRAGPHSGSQLHLAAEHMRVARPGESLACWTVQQALTELQGCALCSAAAAPQDWKLPAACGAPAAACFLSRGRTHNEGAFSGLLRLQIAANHCTAF
jgi:hypothetical protein